jgi:hypothetical protein
LKAIYEDTYSFELDGIAFTIRCKIDSFGVHYFPDAWHRSGERAAGRMLRYNTDFNDLNFVAPPSWLVNNISPDYSMFTEKQKATRREKDGYIAATEEEDQRIWQRMVGPNGIWTASYTEHWLINQFLPRCWRTTP